MNVRMFVLLALVLCLLTPTAFAQEGWEKLDIRINYLGGQTVNRNTFPIGKMDSSERSWSATIHDQNGVALDATFLVGREVVIGYRGSFSMAHVNRMEYFGYENEVRKAEPYRDTNQFQKMADTKYHEVFVLVPALRHFSVVVGATYIGFNESSVFPGEFGISSTNHTNGRSVGPVLGLAGKRWFRGFEFNYSGRLYPRLSSSEKAHGSSPNDKGVMTKWSNSTMTSSSYGFELDGAVSYPLTRLVRVELGYRYRPIYTPHQYENQDYHTGRRFTQSGMTLGLGFGF